MDHEDIMMRKDAVLAVFGCCFIAAVFWVVSCARNPVTGRQELMLVSEDDELKLGQQTDAEIIQEHGVYKDPQMRSYLNEICQRLGKFSHRPNLNYQLKILDVAVVNAFAVPGGYIYFTRGILATLDNEAELAGVMGHEIGHIAARHSAQQLSRAQLAQFGVAVAEVIPGMSGLAQLGAGMLFLRFSRDNEREADKLGVDYSTRAGYDATQMAAFFETLERMNPGSDRSGLPSWFSTHPSPEDRVQAVRARAVDLQRSLNLQQPKVNRQGYLRTIDGVVFGEDPRQGYVAEGMFFHPDLRFQFPVPEDWKVNNTPTQVQMVSKAQDAIILFSMAKGASSQEAARTFVAQTKASVIKTDGLDVSGFSSQRVISDLRTDQGSLRVMSYFIQKERTVYVFHGLTPLNAFQKHQALFNNTMRQFRELTDPRRIHVQPDRLRIRPAGRADTLENGLRSLGVPEKQLKETVLLNGGVPNQRIAANTLLKVVDPGR
jgi:predicted Zn-dependent protease